MPVLERAPLGERPHGPMLPCVRPGNHRTWHILSESGATKGWDRLERFVKLPRQLSKEYAELRADLRCSDPA